MQIRMINKYHKIINKLTAFLLICSTVVLPVFISCRSISSQKKNNTDASQTSVQRKYELVHLKSEQCKAFLEPLNISDIRYVPNTNIVFISGTQEQLKKADAVIDVVDSTVEYSIENLGDESVLDGFPPLVQIAVGLGNIDLGTFDKPPVSGTKSRGIIDVCGNSMLAYIPVSYQSKLLKLLSNQIIKVDSQKAVLAQTEPNKYLSDKIYNVPSRTVSSKSGSDLNKSSVQQQSGDKEPSIKRIQDLSYNKVSTTIVALSEMADPNDIDVNAIEIQPQKETYDELPKTVSISIKPASNDSENPEKILTGKAEPANGEDLLELTLPETLTLVQLLDLPASTSV